MSIKGWGNLAIDFGQASYGSAQDMQLQAKDELFAEVRFAINL